MAEIGQLDVAIDVWELLKGRILIPEIDICPSARRPARRTPTAKPIGDLRLPRKQPLAAPSRSSVRGIPIIRQPNLEDGHIQLSRCDDRS